MQELFVTCPHHIESILCKELSSLGIRSVRPGFCGAFLPATLENVFKVNYQSRVATRVLWPLAQFRCHHKDDLYRQAKAIPWASILSCDKTFAVDANVHQHPTLTNSLFAALLVKDAIVDTFREKEGVRPSVELHTPDVQLNLFIHKTSATLYLDTSGAPLHKRGWREEKVEGTLHETLAAAFLLSCEYTPDTVFCDPFAGSGTFLIEAALLATRTPPGFLRKKWGFFHLPEFDKKAWQQWKQQEDSKKIPLAKGKIFGSDKSRETADACRKHLTKLHFDAFIEVSHEEISRYTPKYLPNLVITNPPYGKRLLSSESLLSQMQDFSTHKLASDGRFYFLWPEHTDTTMQTHLSCKNGGLAIQLVSFPKQKPPCAL